MQGSIQMTWAAARVNAGLQQKAVANNLGINVSTLRKWEKYKTFPPADMIPKICELYGVTYDQIKFLP